MERTISGRENNNNQNIWDKSTYILSTMLYNVSRRYNKSGQNNI